MTSYIVITGYLALMALLLFFAGVKMPIILLVVSITYLLINKHIIRTSFTILRRSLANETLLKVGLVLLFSSIMLWRVRLSAEFEAAPVDTVAGFRIAQIVLALLIGVLRFRKGSLNYLMFSLLTFALVYSCAGILSTLYSSAPMYTLYKATETFTDVILVVSILGSCNNLREFVQFFVIAIGVFLFMEITVWIGMMVWPTAALKSGKGIFGKQLRGILPVINPNKVGFISALLLLSSCFGVVASKLKKEKIFFSTVTLLTLPIFLLAQSRTSTVGVFFAILMFLVLNKKIKWIIVTCVIAGIVFISGALSDIIVGYMIKGENPVMIQTLTGRTLAWEYAWEMFKKSPMFGYGFASGARFDVLKGSSMIGLHGSIFDVLVNLGLVGVIPWLCAIFGVWIQLLRTFLKYSKKMHPETLLFHTFMVSIVVLLTFRSVTATALVMHDMEFIVFLLILGYSQLSTQHRGFTSAPESHGLTHAR